MNKSQAEERLPHPIQPLIMVDGVIRFQGNAIVRYLLDAGPFDLNHIARKCFHRADREQFAQLIGYSYHGFGELSYASDRVYDQADKDLQARIGKATPDEDLSADARDAANYRWLRSGGIEGDWLQDYCDGFKGGGDLDATIAEERKKDGDL